jgi:transposase
MEVTLNNREQKRLQILNLAMSGKMTKKEALSVLGLSYRHTQRMIEAYGKEGAAALAHGNRQKKPSHALSDEVIIKVTKLARTKYIGFDFSHFTDLLEERESLNFSVPQSAAYSIRMGYRILASEKHLNITAGERVSLNLVIPTAEK